MSARDQKSRGDTWENIRRGQLVSVAIFGGGANHSSGLAEIIVFCAGMEQGIAGESPV